MATLALLGVAAGTLLYKTNQAMAVPVQKDDMHEWSDVYEHGINIRAWYNSANPTSSSAPPADFSILTDPTHPGGHPRDILKHVNRSYLQDVAANNAHTIDTARNKGEFIVLGSQEGVTHVTTNDLSGEWAWRMQRTGNFGYAPGVPGLYEQSPLYFPVGGQMGDFNGPNVSW